MLQLLSKPFFSSLRRRRNVIPVSGGSREGARWPLSFLDQTKARRAEKKFWRPGPPLSQRLGDPPPPDLKVWIRHCRLASPISLFWAAHGLNELLEMRFEFPFNLIGKSTMVFLKRWFTGRTQILVHRWGRRSRISALFRRNFFQLFVLFATKI